MKKAKQNSGPTITTYHKKPKSRSTANKIWTTIHSVYGMPPSWLRMIPARRWFQDSNGEQCFTNTSRWEISFDEKGDDLLILHGPAKEVVEMIPKTKR
jgi:hypothetical protein